MIKINEHVADAVVSGYVDTKYQTVAEAFINNFSKHSELGASCCVRVGEQTVVDLWGGHTSVDKTQAWQEDTISVVFSCTKAMTALCAHLLIERGQLGLKEYVTTYWPEFGQNGKDKITVEMLLNHSSALPAFKQPIKTDGYNDWDYMVKRIEQEQPFWLPGSRNSYHMISFGWTVGELIRRISGMSLGQFFEQEFAQPLQADFWIGLPEETANRVAPVTMASVDESQPMSDFMIDIVNNPTSTSHLALLNSGGHNANSADTLRAEIGGAGGVSNARAMAKLFTPLANDGKANGKQYFSTKAVKQMSNVSTASMLDATLLVPTRFALGFMKSIDNRQCQPGNRDSFIIGDRAFGHVGAGGSAVFADPDSKLSFAYTMNLMGTGILLNQRGQKLIDATYQSMGYADNSAGYWSIL
jgi:CubicO group peptidase (beta-lactamase class C family)